MTQKKDEEVGEENKEINYEGVGGEIGDQL